MSVNTGQVRYTEGETEVSNFKFIVDAIHYKSKYRLVAKFTFQGSVPERIFVPTLFNHDKLTFNPLKPIDRTEYVTSDPIDPGPKTIFIVIYEEVTKEKIPGAAGVADMKITFDIDNVRKTAPVKVPSTDLTPC